MILVTGSSGPLGKAMRITCQEENIKFVDSTWANLTSRESTLDAFSAQQKIEKLSGIVHLAAKSGGSQLSSKEPASLLHDNLEMVVNVLEAARIHDVKDVVLVSSIAAYPTSILNPSEDQLFEGPIESVDYAYGYAKRLFVPLMRAYNHQYSMSIKVVIVNGIIGPFMSFEEGRSILPATLIKKFSESQDSHSPLRVMGDGTPLREYTYSIDLARNIFWSYFHQEPNTALNIGHSKRYSVRNIAEMICRSLELDESRLRFDGTNLGARKIQSTDNSLFLKLSGLTFTPIEVAIQKTCDWYLSQNTLVRKEK